MSTWIPIYVCRYPDENEKFFNALFAHPPFLKKYGFTESEISQAYFGDKGVWDALDEAPEASNEQLPVLDALRNISDLITDPDAIADNEDMEGMAGARRDDQNEQYVNKLKKHFRENCLCWPKGGLAIGVLGFREDRFVDLWTFDGMEWCNNGEPKCIKSPAILNKMLRDTPKIYDEHGTSTPVRSRSRNATASDARQSDYGITPIPQFANYHDENETPQMYDGAESIDSSIFTLSDKPMTSTPDISEPDYSSNLKIQMNREIDSVDELDGLFPFPDWFQKYPVAKRQDMCTRYEQCQKDWSLNYDELCRIDSSTKMKRNKSEIAKKEKEVLDIFEKELEVEGLTDQMIYEFMTWRRNFRDPESIIFPASPLSICDINPEMLNSLPIKGPASEDPSIMSERYQTIGRFVTSKGQEDATVAAMFPCFNLVTKSSKNSPSEKGFEVDWERNIVTKVYTDSWADTPRGAGVQVGWRVLYVSIKQGPKKPANEDTFTEALNTKGSFRMIFAVPVDESPIFEKDWYSMTNNQRKYRFQERHREDCWQMLRQLRPIENLDDHKDWIVEVFDELFETGDSLIMPVAMHRFQDEHSVCPNPKVLWMYMQFVSNLFNLVTRQTSATCFRCGMDIDTDVTSEWWFVRVIMTLWLLRLRSCHPEGKLRMDREETCKYFGLTEAQYQWFFTPILGEVASLEVYQFESMEECLSMMLYALKNELTVLPELLQSVYDDEFYCQPETPLEALDSMAHSPFYFQSLSDLNSISEDKSESTKPDLAGAESDSLPPVRTPKRRLTRAHSERMDARRKEYQYTSVLANWANSGQALSRIDNIWKKNTRLKIDFRVRYQFRITNRSGHDKSWGILEKSLRGRRKRHFGGFISKFLNLDEPLEIEKTKVSTEDHSPEHPAKRIPAGDMPYLRIMKLYFGFSHIFQQCDPIVSSDNQWNIITGMKKANAKDNYPVYNNKSFFYATGLEKDDLQTSIRKIMSHYKDICENKCKDEEIREMRVRDFTQPAHKNEDSSPKILNWFQKRGRKEMKPNGKLGSRTIALVAKVIPFEDDDGYEADEGHADHHPNEAWHHFRLHNANCDDVVDLYAIIKDSGKQKYYVVQEFGDNDLEGNILQLFNVRSAEDADDWQKLRQKSKKDPYALQNNVFLPLAKQLHAVVWRLHHIYKTTHNDFKPKNIVLCKAFADKTLEFKHRVKLIDFGQMQYCPPVQRYFMLDNTQRDQVEYNTWRSYEHCGTVGYWSLEKFNFLSRIPDVVDDSVFTPTRLPIPDELKGAFAESDDDSDSESDSEESVVEGEKEEKDGMINIYDRKNLHDCLCSVNKEKLGYEARKAELFALAMTYFFILTGEKPFTSLEIVFKDPKEWKSFMNFTDGQYLKVGTKDFAFAKFLKKKMKKNRLEPHIVEYIRRLTLPEPDRPLLVEEDLTKVLEKIKVEMKR